MKEKVEAQGLVAESQNLALTAEVQRLTRIVGNVGNANSNGSTRKIICHHCGIEGHISPNCPNKVSGATGTVFKLRQAPKDGGSHAVTHKQYKWCGTCKRWNFGEKAHLTNEHVKKQTPGPAAQLAQASSDTNTTAVAPNEVMGTLSRVAGYHGSIQSSGISNHATATQHVVGYVASMTNLSTEEEDAAAAADLANWLIVDCDGNPFCRHCKVITLDWKLHEATNTHFQTRLLSDMHDHFKNNCFAPLMDADETEEASGLYRKTEEAQSVGRQTEEATYCKTEEEQSVSRQTEEAPTSNSLKALTGQR